MPIKIAAIIFPFLALFLSLPILIHQYRKYGVFVRWYGVVIYSFIFYLLVAYFLVILPLPEMADVAKLTTPAYNLKLFTFVREFQRETVLVLSDPGTYLTALRQPVVIQPLFNVFLTVPFGVYLRYYFKRNLRQTVMLTFLLSLFFELTQLSGLYGIYPRPYRLFDVDDLLLNTIGGVAGYWLMPVLQRMFPREAAIRSLIESPERHRVTMLRRLVAFTSDAIIVSFLLDVLPKIISSLLGVFTLPVALAVYHIIVPKFLLQGQTLGKKLVNIRIVSEENGDVPLRSLIKRQLLLYGVIVPIIFYLLPNSLTATGVVPLDELDLYYFLILLFGGFAVLFALHVIWQSVFKKDRLIYEELSRTKQISTK